jgi:hypothetical protein
MGYLDIPRIHFAGLFFAGPSTINNITTNYMPQVPIEKPDGEFAPNALWYPTGVAQLFLHRCKILGAVNAAGGWVGSGDPIIGAPMETPSPYTPVENGRGGVYDIAKLVDLDPDQQGRSAVYGLRFRATLPGNVSFGGAATAPELRELGPRIPLKVGSFTAVGQWLATIGKPEWPASSNSSPILSAFQRACANGIAVELTVDLHWNNPKISQNGLTFCYGRVHGTMGPLRNGESAQILYGRRMVAVSAPSIAAPLRREAVAAFTAAAATDPPAQMPTWNTSYAASTPAVNPSLLHVDLGMAIPLAVQAPTANPPGVNGKPFVETGITVGTLDSGGNFTALANGAVSFTAYYQLLESMEKNCYLWTNSGVFTIPLAAGEAATLAANPLAVAVGGNPVAAEVQSGIWVQIGEMVERMPLPGASAAVPIVITERGAPAPGQTPPAAAVQAIEWVKTGGQWQPTQTASTDLTASYNPATTGANGATTLKLATAVPDIALSQVRAALDSRMYYILMNAPDDVSVCDDYTPVSALVWRPFTPPASPTWANAIEPILGAYARLYPGMKDKVDIGDEATAKSTALSILQRMALPISDPAYMPVTRDLAPAKVAMVVKFMKDWLDEGSTPT